MKDGHAENGVARKSWRIVGAEKKFNFFVTPFPKDFQTSRKKFSKLLGSRFPRSWEETFQASRKKLTKLSQETSISRKRLSKLREGAFRSSEKMFFGVLRRNFSSSR